MGKLSKWKRLAERLSEEVYVVYAAARDPRTPWYAKLLALAIVGYVISPIDLIPDFIPFVGLLDELLIIPAGIWLVKKLIPAEVLADARQRAASMAHYTKKILRVATIVIVSFWVIVALAGFVVIISLISLANKF